MLLTHRTQSAFVDNLNTAETALAKAITDGDITRQLELQRALNFNGGGHINHSQFWKILAPPKSKDAKYDEESQFGKRVAKDFGSYDGLVTAVNTTGSALQGSGWLWIGYNVAAGRLEVTTTRDQDPLLTLKPIIG